LRSFAVIRRDWKIRGRLSGWRGLLATSALLAVCAGPFVASGEVSGEEGDPPPAVTLDQLLTLPSSLRIEAEQKGGTTRSEWRAQFVAAEAELEAAKTDLDASLDRLRDVSAEKGGMKLASPMQGAGGGGMGETPLDYGLKNEIREGRDAVFSSERRLQELKLEASLAGVPPEWLTEEAD
jgi:hypothetical protein